MQLHIIRESHDRCEKEISFKYDPLYEKLVEFINSDNIRKGTNESIRTKELATAFNIATSSQISYKNKLPQVMSKIMIDNPQLGITKKIKNYGTIYCGIGLSTDPTPKVNNPPLTTKEKNDRRALRNKHILESIKDIICQQSGWTKVQYQQMVNLSMIYIIRDGTYINIEAMICVTLGRLIQYINEKNIVLKQAEKYANLVKADFERCVGLDSMLLENMGVTYTNRLLAAERTYDAGSRLSAAIVSYNNTIQNLPYVQHIVYPNIQYLQDLSSWLKSHSMHKTRTNMRIDQENFEFDDSPNQIREEILHEYSDVNTLITLPKN